MASDLKNRFELDIFAEQDWQRLGQPKAAEEFLLNTAAALRYYTAPPTTRYQHYPAHVGRELFHAYEDARLRICSFVTRASLPAETDLDAYDDLRVQVTPWVECGLKWGAIFADYVALEGGLAAAGRNDQVAGEVR